MNPTPITDSLLSLYLEQRTNISVLDVLELLNSNDEDAIVSPLWTGDAFYETNSGAVRSVKDVERFSQTIRTDRQSALLKVRRCIDEWIDSAKLGNVEIEKACNRSEGGAPQAALETRRFWETSRIKFVRRPRAVDASQAAPGGDKPRLLPPDENDFENAGWKATRIIALVLSSDLRFRLAKCRYQKCKRPYFVLRNPNKVYAHGIFCSVRHNRAATVPERVIKRRQQFHARLIDWAATYVRQRGTGRDNQGFKEDLAAHLRSKISKLKRPVRDGVSKNWVTRNWKEIEAKASPKEHSIAQVLG